MRATISGVVLTLVVGTVSADTLDLDQVSPFFFDETEASFNMDAAGMVWQQEVVAGLAGNLAQVDFYVFAPGSCTLALAAGEPWQATYVWSTTFAPTATGWVSLDTSAAGLSFSPGDHYVLDFINTSGGLCLGGSYQPGGGNYPAGRLFYNGYDYGDWDVAFRTYVPEPSGVALAMLGAVLMLRRR